MLKTESVNMPFQKKVFPKAAFRLKALALKAYMLSCRFSPNIAPQCSLQMYKSRVHLQASVGSGFQPAFCERLQLSFRGKKKLHFTVFK